MLNKIKESQSFIEKKKIIEMQRELAKFQHKLTMDDLIYRRESDRIHHERELERGRIKSSEIKKTILLKGQEGRNRY